MIPRFAIVPVFFASFFTLLVLGSSPSVAQPVYTVDQFNPSGANGFSYSGGQIKMLWTNWFGTSYQNLIWDPTSDANTNANSGSMMITNNFSTTANQFAVYDGFNGIVPPINGFLVTNFQCSVRFANSSATTGSGGAASYGFLQFGVATYNFGQDYFGGVSVPVGNTNWVQVNIPVNAIIDTNLILINDLLIHIYGPNFTPALSGPSTFWVDNIQFTGPNLVNSSTVDWNSVAQRIDGFGASSAWQSTWNSSEADLFFSTNNGILYTNSSLVVTTNNGIGLSLLRNRIMYASTTSASDTPTSVETSIMQMAQARGARVWSTPWTPAAGFKSINDIYDSGKATASGIDGGSFLGSGNNITNINYASQLANYVTLMKNTYGINLYAISIQNEPDADVTTYDACQWSGAQIHDFVTNLYNAFQTKLPKTITQPLIIIPEDENWHTNLYLPAMSDPNVAQDVGIVACHNYDGSPPENVPFDFSKFSNPNAAYWETEVSLLSGSDSSITNAIYWASRIHLFLTVGQVNAWHYWWLMTGAGGNQGLTDNTASPTKRLFALGQFSRFVRPNYYRIGANCSGSALISAYKDSASLSYAIVAINPNLTNIVQTFSLANFPAASTLTPWITSSNLSLAPQSVITVANSTFTYTIPAMSIVTFAGVATNHAPALTPVSDQTVNAGVTVTVTNLASDVDAPPQTLAFSLLNAPATASLNSSSGVVSWRPPVSAANTTNLISVAVTDGGMPALSATNNFHVIVNPLPPPAISSITTSGPVIKLSANGLQGPDYTILTSTNLTSWQAVFTTNSPALPFTFNYTNSGNEVDRFFRIQLGP